MGRTKNTTDHDTIRKWAEERNGKPAIITKGGSKSDLLHFKFPDNNDKNLEEIEWEEWFEIFDNNNLAFIYLEKTKEGTRSNFNKVVEKKSLSSV